MTQRAPDFATVVRRRVQALMDERGYSQRDLAERLQCAQSTISQLLSGQRRRRDLDVWRNIARLFDRPFAQLMAEAETLYGHLLTDAKRQKGEGPTTGKSADKSQLLSQHAIVKNASEDRLARRNGRAEAAGSPGAGDGKRFVLVVGGSAFDGHIVGEDDAMLELLAKLDDPEADRIFERIAQRVYEKLQVGGPQSANGDHPTHAAPGAGDTGLHGGGPSDAPPEHRSKHPRRDRPGRGDDTPVRTRRRV